MTDARAAEIAFAAPHDAPIRYLERTREYYQALGYGAPYEWAHYSDVPFLRWQIQIRLRIEPWLALE